MNENQNYNNNNLLDDLEDEVEKILIPTIDNLKNTTNVSPNTNVSNQSTNLNVLDELMGATNVSQQKQYETMANLKTKINKDSQRNGYDLLLSGDVEGYKVLNNSKNSQKVAETSILRDKIEVVANASVLGVQVDIWLKNSFPQLPNTEHFNILTIKPIIKLSGMRATTDLSLDKDSSEKEAAIKAANDRIAKYSSICNGLIFPKLLELKFEPRIYRESDFDLNFKRDIVNNGFGLLKIGENEFIKYHKLSKPKDVVVEAKTEEYFKNAQSLYKWAQNKEIPIYKTAIADIICKMFGSEVMNVKVSLIKNILNEMTNFIKTTIANPSNVETMLPDIKKGMKASFKEVLKDAKETPVAVVAETTQLGFINFKIKSL